MGALIDNQAVNPDDYAIGVNFMKAGKQYYFDYSTHPNLEPGDYVIVATRNLGEQMGQVKCYVPRTELDSRTRLHPIMRAATPADLLSNQQWKEKETEILMECREKAARLGNFKHVKFVAAEFNYNGTFLTIMLTTEEKGRLNITRLRSALQKKVKAQIEFRQIGPRDVARIQGGFGACGIERCCTTFLTDFSMVSINMAKVQEVSLNPSEITGMCGRLRCCLSYEYEQYVEARKALPRMYRRIGTPHGEGKVVDVHPIKDGVTVEIEDKLHFVTREEIIPLEEWKALQKAASSGCGCSTGGKGECQAHSRARIRDDAPVPATIEEESVTGEASVKDSPAETGQRTGSGRRNKRGRSRRRSGQQKQDKVRQQQGSGQQSSETDIEKKPGSGRGKRRQRNQRNRRRRGGSDTDKT